MPYAGCCSSSLAIFLAALSFNLLGDALRDVMELRLRGMKPVAGLLLGGQVEQRRKAAYGKIARAV